LTMTIKMLDLMVKKMASTVRMRMFMISTEARMMRPTTRRKNRIGMPSLKIGAKRRLN
jgi:hypothetical protein